MFDNDLLLFTASIVGSFILAFIYFSGKINVLKSKLEAHLKHTQLLRQELDQERQLLKDANSRSHQLEITNTKLSETLENIRARYDQEVNNKEKQLERFENLANRVLLYQSKSLHESQQDRMKEILDPLKEKLVNFEAKIEKTNLETTKQHESLKEQIKYLNEKSDQVSKDANNLVKALKGDFKKQGNWGELILDSILDKSGLMKNREYYVQNSQKNSQGKILRPDVVIQLPDNKKIIIDSKVSLVAYDKMVNAETEEDQINYQKAHAIAIKNHIDDLTGKNYHQLYGIDSPDFVLLFIPIDTAFSSALEANEELYNYAFDRNIVIVSASTLLATLKTVESMWRNEKQNKYALEIAAEAGKMYDKFVGFIEDMEKLKSQMNTSQNTFDAAMKKLNTGTGNLISKAEKVKALGARASKSLS